MAWNRPSENNKRAARRSAPTPSHIKGLIAGGIVVLGAGIAAWLILGPEEAKPVGADPRAARPPVIEQTAVVAPVPAKAAKDYSRLSDWDIRHVPEDETNNLSSAQLEYWKQSHPWPPPVASEQPNWGRSRTSIFKEKAHNEIAFVVGLEPGTRIFAERRLDERFVKRFLASVDKPIVINADDSDYDKWLKQTVIDAKAGLKAAYDRGEDIVKIMNDARSELMRLGRLKEDVLSVAAEELRRNPSGSPEEEELLIQTVNRMLEEKGIAPVGGDSISRLAIRRRAIRKINKGE